LELKLPSRQSLARMHVVFAGVPEQTLQLEETRNMQVGRINLGALQTFLQIGRICGVCSGTFFTQNCKLMVILQFRAI
jgi:hypothetical protein